MAFRSYLFGLFTKIFDSIERITFDLILWNNNRKIFKLKNWKSYHYRVYLCTMNIHLFQWDVVSNENFCFKLVIFWLKIRNENAFHTKAVHTHRILKFLFCTEFSHICMNKCMSVFKSSDNVILNKNMNEWKKKPNKLWKVYSYGLSTPKSVRARKKIQVENFRIFRLFC